MDKASWEKVISHRDLSGKQDKLVSGVNIKTFNGTSILGSGNITIEGVDKKVVVPPMRSHLIPIPVDKDYYTGKKLVLLVIV